MRQIKCSQITGAIAGSHARRDADYRWLVDPQTRELIDELGIKLISYRDLKEAMRRQ